VALKSRLPKIAAGIPHALDTSVGETVTQDGKPVRDRLCPVDTGALLQSGEARRVGEAHWQLREGDGLPDARAAFTEWGTSRQSAQPHVTPAAEVMRRALPVRIAAGLRKVIR
jgi:hypothetical protein